MKKITPEQAIKLDIFCGMLGDSHYKFERTPGGNFAIFSKGEKSRITSWSERTVLLDTDFVFYLDKNSNIKNY